MAGCRGRDRAASVDIVSERDWMCRLYAAKEAAEGTDCMIIAKTSAKYIQGMDSAIRRCKRAGEAGAEVVSIEGLDQMGEARQMAEAFPGDKLWSGLRMQNGSLPAEPKELEQLGFKLVTLFYTEKASMHGMLDFAKNNLKNGNTVYHDQHNFDGLLEPGEDYHKFFSFHKKWVPLEQEFLDVKELCELPNVTGEENTYGK